MKYARYIIVLIVFIAIAVLLTRNGRKEYDTKNEALNNKIAFKGLVTDVNQSRNHAFGIIRLQLIESSAAIFDAKLNEGMYPYKIKGKVAELYTIIPDGIDIGDSVSLKSSDKNAHYYNVKTKKNSEGYIWVITNDNDINFVQQNTIFK